MSRNTLAFTMKYKLSIDLKTNATNIILPFCGKKKIDVSPCTILFARSSILRNDLSRLSANCTFPAFVNSHVVNQTHSTRTIRVIIMASLTLNLILMSQVYNPAARWTK